MSDNDLDWGKTDNYEVGEGGTFQRMYRDYGLNGDEKISDS